MLKNTSDFTNNGLSSVEANAILKKEGYNEIASAKKKSVFRIAFDVIKEPMFVLLLAGGAIYIVLGELKDALILISFVFLMIGITFYQEGKTERALEALKDLSSPRALVIRDGQEKRIPGREVVRGDILILSEGDRIPADAVVISSTNFSVDESLLTGESLPVRKTSSQKDMQNTRPGGDNTPYVYSSTLAVKGQCIARVTSVGINTEVGKIGKALQEVKSETTLLQKETGKIVKSIAIMSIILCVIVVVVYALTKGSWLKGILAGITLGMAMLPEEFPVVLTVFLALGAWRMSKKQVLTRKISAVETLGSASVLCVDKTGTLTMNKMEVQTIYNNNELHQIDYKNNKAIPEQFHSTIEFSILASQKNPFDPMEKAFKELGDLYLSNTEHIHGDWSLIKEYPLSDELLALSYVWESQDTKKYVIASKGAPEAIADLCHFNEKQLQELTAKITMLANQGLRVLGVARAYFNKEDLPKVQHDFDFEFLGLIGIADPVRPTVPAALQECYKAGIRMIMITGDYPGTAQSIGRGIGLKSVDKFITGYELDKMSDEDLREKIKEVNIFARVVPEQKLRIVNALKENGEIVAMTGDGVNDAPALKSANIGIAMGGRGTDVAREAASIVLLDDDFSSIVQAVKAGRRIFDNLKKAMAYIFAIHIPIAGLSLIPIIFGLPMILLPVHIVFMEMVIDPSCSLIFEAEHEESDIMTRPPRKPDERLFGINTVLISFLQGFIVLAFVLGVFIFSLKKGMGEFDARAITFTALIVANIGLILTNRSWTRSIIKMMKTPNSALIWVCSGAIIFLGVILYVPFMKNLFHFATLHLNDLLISLAVGLGIIVLLEGIKLFRRKKTAISVSI